MLFRDQMEGITIVNKIRLLGFGNKKNKRIINRILDEINEIEPFQNSRDFVADIGEFIIKLEDVPGDILEIGTFRGKTAIFCARLLEEIGSEKWVITVDPYIHLFEETEKTKKPGTVINGWGQCKENVIVSSDNNISVCS